jgi:hypothetical protein
VQTLDSIRRRIYIAPLGLYLTLDRGTFERVALNPATGAVRVTLSPVTALSQTALLRIEQPATVAGVGRYTLVGTYAAERAGWVIPLTPVATTVELK